MKSETYATTRACSERIVGQRPVRAQPHVLVGRARPLGRPRVATRRSASRSAAPRAHGAAVSGSPRRPTGAGSAARIDRGRARRASGRSGRAVLEHVERRGHVEDRSPCWIATTRRVVKLRPSRMRSTSKTIGISGRRAGGSTRASSAPDARGRRCGPRPRGACASTWPPNMRCAAFFGLTPRNRFTSSCSSSRRSTRSSIGVPTTAKATRESAAHPKNTLATSSSSRSTVFSVAHRVVERYPLDVLAAERDHRAEGAVVRPRRSRRCRNGSRARGRTRWACRRAARARGW